MPYSIKFLVTGVNGQLGHDVMNELFMRGYLGIGSDLQPGYCGIADGSPVTRAEYMSMDITDHGSVMRILDEIRPDVIVHCSGWTAVDAAEDEANISRVYAVNSDGARYIAEAAGMIGSKMIYISTDYVFDGSGTLPWSPDCRDFGPLNVYGKSKLEGELAVSQVLDRFFIVRISWAFGLNGKNFVRTMIDIGKTHEEVRVVNDQIGTPTYTRDLARLLIDMAESDKYGYYHATNEGGYISWYDLAVEIYRQYGLKTRLIPVSTAEYGQTKAVRPFNSRLDKSKLGENGFKPLPVWQDALRRYLEEWND